MFSLFFTTNNPISRALLDLCFGWLIVYAARLAWKRFHTSSLLKHVPGPKSTSWLWGFEWDMYRTPPDSRYIGWKEQYGDIVKFKGAFGRSLLAVSDYKTATYILGDHVWDFPKPAGVREWFRLLVGDGLLVVEGKEAHSRQRKIFSPAFTQQSIRKLLPIFYENASKVADAWAAKVESSPCDEIVEDVQWWSNRFSLDTIGYAGFSHNFSSLSGTHNPLVHALEALGNTADNFSSFLMRALFFSFPWILSIPSDKGKKIRDTREELGKVATRMWKQAKDTEDAGGKTLMSSMIKADQSAGNDKMSEEEIANQLRTLVQAGYETVSSAIAWMFYELARHPELQDRVRREVLAVTGDPTSSDFLEHTPILDAVVKETIRLHPSIPELTHITSKDAVVPLSSPLPNTSEYQFVIPAQTIIQIPVNVLQTDTAVWGPDATEFRPGRWLEIEKEKAEQVRLHQDLMAFSFGPRKCPGRYFATMEMKTIAAVLLRQFTLSLVPDKKIQSFWSFTVRTRVEGEKNSTLPLRISKIKY